jgi:hypothetical protein
MRIIGLSSSLPQNGLKSAGLRHPDRPFRLFCRWQIEMIGGPQPAIVLFCTQYYALTVGDVRGARRQPSFSFQAGRQVAATSRAIKPPMHCALKEPRTANGCGSLQGRRRKGSHRQKHEQGIGRIVHGRSSLCTDSTCSSRAARTASKILGFGRHKKAAAGCATKPCGLHPETGRPSQPFGRRLFDNRPGRAGQEEFDFQIN